MDKNLKRTIIVFICILSVLILYKFFVYPEISRWREKKAYEKYYQQETEKRKEIMIGIVGSIYDKYNKEPSEEQKEKNIIRSIPLKEAIELCVRQTQ